MICLLILCYFIFFFQFVLHNDVRKEQLESDDHEFEIIHQCHEVEVINISVNELSSRFEDDAVCKEFKSGDIGYGCLSWAVVHDVVTSGSSFDLVSFFLQTKTCNNLEVSCAFSLW